MTEQKEILCESCSHNKVCWKFKRYYQSNSACGGYTDCEDYDITG